MKTLIDLPLVAPFLDAAAEDTAPDVRLAAVDTLTRLPLTSGAWRAVAERGIALLRDFEESASLDTRAFDVLARIPVRSIRVGLGVIAQDNTHRDSLTCAIALGRQRDAAGLGRLLRGLSDEPTDLIAATIASLPIEELDVIRTPFKHALTIDDLTVRFWAALALARLGDSAPLRQAWRRLPSDPPTLFHGDPRTPYRALARMRPLPDALHRSIVDIYKRALARVQKADGPDARLPRDAGLFVGGLTGLLDPYGDPLPHEPILLEGDEFTQSPDPVAGQRLLEELRAIGVRLESDPSAFVQANNAILDAASATPAPFDLPVRTILGDQKILQLPRSALTWALARAGPHKLVEEMGPLVASGSPEERRELITFSRDIATHWTADAPYAGVGVNVAEHAAPILDIVDDVEPIVITKETTESQTATVYPDISVSNEHPVSTEEIAIDVELSGTKTEGTEGSVTLPGADPTRVHTLDVRLLLGATLMRDTLEYSLASGTTKKAHFVARVPDIGGEPQSTIQVRVNFYLNHRWCGQGARPIDVRRDGNIPPADLGGPPRGTDAEPPLHLEFDAQPADLTVRICKGRNAGEYIWECESPHVTIPRPAAPEDARTDFTNSPEAFVRQQFEPLATKSLAELESADVEGIGEAIYRASPRVFKDAYWQVWHAAQDVFEFESVQIVSDEPYVPWELMRVADDNRGPGVAAEFLAVRHSVGRWIASETARMLQRIAVSSVAVSASDYPSAPKAKQLPWAKDERDFLEGTYGARCVPLISTDVLDFLHHGKAQAVHFACHGRMLLADPLASQLLLEDEPKTLKPTTVNRAEVRHGIGHERPLVFLNACEAGGIAATLSLVAGFPAAFLDVGAAAVVCPLWGVGDESAHDISKMFYGEVFSNASRPLGRVMRDIRAKWRDKQRLTFLAYVLYGDPLARIHYQAPGRP